MTHRLSVILSFVPKRSSDMFDVTMDSFDGAEVCGLIGLFFLDNLSDKYGKSYVGLYRDDRLVHNQNGLERTSHQNSRNND